MPKYKAIEGFPGYRVGDDGSVWSCLTRIGLGKGKGTGYSATGEWKQINGGRDKDGYRKVILCANGKRRHARVCCLVLEAFTGPRPPGLKAAHDNGINDDDRASNLFWKTQKANIADKIRHGTAQIGEKHPQSITTEADVIEMRRMKKEGHTLGSIAKRFHLKIVTVQAAVSGRNWKHVPGAIPPKSLPRGIRK